MPRPSRRQELLDAALAAFASRGSDATSIGQLADVLGVSKAAVSYHFPTKDDLLTAVAEPLLHELESLVGSRPRPDGPDALRDLLTAYTSILLERKDAARWLDTDPAVQAHPEIGPRIQQLHQATRELLTGSDRDDLHVAAASALGAVWRPIRNLDPSTTIDPSQVTDAAVTILRMSKPRDEPAR